MDREADDLQRSQDESEPEVDADERRLEKPSKAEGEREPEKESDVEEQSEQSFPASDPPSH